MLIYPTFTFINLNLNFFLNGVLIYLMHILINGSTYFKIISILSYNAPLHE